MTIPVDGPALRRIFSHYPTGVTIVTTTHEGQPCGLTVNSFTSVSLEPPLILICLARHARAHRCVEVTHHFAVNILTAGQEALARLFATKVEDKFRGLSYRPSPGGDPILDGVHGWLDCEVVATHPGGNTHTIYVALVTAMDVGAGAPLVFHHGAYTRLGSATRS